jgi:arginyl-tRNA synthetase
MFLEKHLASVAADVLEKTLSLDETPNALLRGTQDPKFGDYQVNGVIALAKKAGKNPRELAEPVAAALLARPEIAKAEVAGPGFVNLTLDAAWIGGVLSAMLGDEKLGVDPVAKKETIVVDFSSPNIAKQMHVGHLRSTILGAALVKLLRFVGHEVIGDNHLGDWGTQFGLLIVGMREYGDEAALAEDAIVELERVYKLASTRAKEDEAFATEARAELAKLQQGDAGNRAMWEMFVATTRTTLDRMYDRLGVSFDAWLGESAYDAMLPGVVELLLGKGLAREDEGAICVFWNELVDAGLPVPKRLAKQKEPFIVRKKDGAFLYSTSDVATIQYRRERWNADRAIYVVGSPQSLHFEQLFALAHLLGETMRLEHVALLDEAEERALAAIREKAEEGGLRIPEEEWAQAAKTIGIGAVKYADLMQNRITDYRFDWEKLISFKGNASPYLQYMYARVRSVLQKGDVAYEGFASTIAPEEPAELALARTLLRFPDVVSRAAEESTPHVLAEHLFAVASEFSRFYTECPVLESEQRQSRLGLCVLTARQLETGLGLLGIEVIERM